MALRVCGRPSWRLACDPGTRPGAAGLVLGLSPRTALVSPLLGPASSTTSEFLGSAAAPPIVTIPDTACAPWGRLEGPSFPAAWWARLPLPLPGSSAGGAGARLPRGDLVWRRSSEGVQRAHVQETGSVWAGARDCGGAARRGVQARWGAQGSRLQLRDSRR